MFWVNSPFIFLIELSVINLFDLNFSMRNFLMGFTSFVSGSSFSSHVGKRLFPSPGASDGATKSSFLARSIALGRTIIGLKMNIYIKKFFIFKHLSKEEPREMYITYKHELYYHHRIHHQAREG